MMVLGYHQIYHLLWCFSHWRGFRFLINGPLKIAPNKTVISIYRKSWFGCQRCVFLPCGKEPIWFYSYLSSWALIITLLWNLTFSRARWAALSSCSPFSFSFVPLLPKLNGKIRVGRIQQPLVGGGGARWGKTRLLILSGCFQGRMWWAGQHQPEGQNSLGIAELQCWETRLA